MVEPLIQDLRYAIRALRSSRGFAAVAILSLALGIGANTAIFSLINSLMLKTLPVSHPEQLLQVTLGKEQYFSNPVWEQLRDRQDVFSGLSHRAAHVSISPRAVKPITSMAVMCPAGSSKPSACALFWAAHCGRGRQARLPGNRHSQPGVLAKGVCGRTDIIGKIISLDNHPFEISACSGLDSRRPGRQCDRCLRTGLREKIIRGEYSSLDKRSNWWLEIVGRPKPGISQAQATARLKALAPEIFKATLPPNWKAEDQAEYYS